MISRVVHNPLAAIVADPDWAKSVAIEASELLQDFQQGAETEELADLLTYCLLLAHCKGVDRAGEARGYAKKLRSIGPEKVARSTMSSKIARLDFSKHAVTTWKSHDEKHGDWPVVYILDDGRDTTSQSSSNRLRDIYVGESLNAAGRLRQHLETPAKQHLKKIRVIIDERFNKSVCLDLESYLIKMLAGDGANRVLNRNNGITEANYYQREVYRDKFRNVVERLKDDGIFTRTIPEIETSDLFKLSPFKALTEDQANSVEEIVNGFLIDLERGAESTMVIQGDPGTGTTLFLDDHVKAWLKKLQAKQWLPFI